MKLRRRDYEKVVTRVFRVVGDTAQSQGYTGKTQTGDRRGGEIEEGNQGKNEVVA